LNILLRHFTLSFLHLARASREGPAEMNYLNLVSLTDHGKVIRILAADYGRHDHTTCSAGHPKCQLRNVYLFHTFCILLAVSFRCNGRHTCIVRVSNSAFGDPCYGTNKYLQLSFFCIRESCNT
uniref:SUEL-type lectin domain-containing protein n=1 Tax=Neogobius melanostomus TaxID=47308 RepID=A0A8C6V089_9GOBI